MFYYLNGTVAEIAAGLAVIDCGGVGYACATTNYTLSQLKKGERARLYTYLHVREDIFELYGFASQQELNSFKMLIGVSGVGPKAALAILSATTPQNLALSIVTEDEKALTAAQGIGKKIAQRIILELKDKLAKEQSNFTVPSGGGSAPMPLGGSKSGEAAHDHGRVVDVFNVKDEGAMGMDRGGGLPVNQLIDYCYAGRSREEVKRTLGRRSGMLSYVGTTDFREICARVVSGDERFTAAYRALVYQLAKDIGAMAAVLHFGVDAIVYTGGMAYEQFFCDDITAYVGRLAPVLRFPGEEEMRALAEGTLRVLHGEAQAETY